MELKRAKEVLRQKGEIFDDFIVIGPWRVDADGTIHTYLQKFEFDPDQLEAIATWMRDPEGVVKA